MTTHVPHPLSSIALCAAALLGSAASLSAQIGGQETVKKILEDVDQQMQEIDRLLLESSRDDAGGGAPATDAVREKVQRSRESQEQVVRGIDKLLEELQQMAQQSQSSSSSSSGEQQDQQRQQQGDQSGSREQGRREQTQTPDMVDQGGQPGEQQQGEQQQGEQPRPGESGRQPRPEDGGHSDDPGRNVDAGERAENASERVERDNAADGDWGRLPPYARFLHSRGGAPDVPARYRRLFEAWQKRVNERSQR